MSREKILIVDDKNIVADILKTSLKKHGYQFTSLAISGEEALQITEKENPDVVLMNIIIKGKLDGITTADQIRQQYGIPVIFLTGNCEEEISQHTHSTDVLEHIANPFDSRQLLVNIEMALYKCKIEKRIQKLLNEIAEHKQMIKKVCESKEKYHAFFEVSNDIAFITSPTGRIIEINDAAVDLFGYKTKEEILGINVHDLYEKPNERRKTLSIIEQQGCAKGIAINFRKKDGSIIKTLVNASIKKNKYTNSISYQGTVHDITDYARMEKNFQEIRETYRKIFDFSPEYTVLVDKDGNILDLNKKAYEVTGYTPEEMIGKNIADISIFDEKNKAIVLEKFSQRIGGIEIPPYELGFFSKNGKIIIGRVIATLLRNRRLEPFGILLMVSDITEQKKAEEQLLAYQEQLRSLATELSRAEARERRRIATYLHDEIGQALVATRMKFGALKKSTNKKEIDQMIDQIQAILGKIIDDTRSVTFDLSPPILYELGFETAIEWIKEKVSEENDIMIEFKNDKLPKPVDEDIGAFLYRSVHELLDNVVCHARARTAKIRIQRNGNYVQIVVKDDGIGFDVTKMHDKTWQTTKFGLFSIKERFESIGGYIKIESEPGQGTSIRLVAPLKSAESTAKVGKI